MIRFLGNKRKKTSYFYPSYSVILSHSAVNGLVAFANQSKDPGRVNFALTWGVPSRPILEEDSS
jgi:hypothetical protein